MMTLRKFSAEPSTIPSITSWYLADLSKAQGKQELFTHQSPQKLKILHEHALIESAVSSNRIEGINVDQSRIDTLILGNPLLKDRDEEEIRGYRDALRLIHEKAGEIPVSEETILKFHKLSRGQIWDAGKYKEKNVIMKRLSKARKAGMKASTIHGHSSITFSTFSKTLVVNLKIASIT